MNFKIKNSIKIFEFQVKWDSNPKILFWNIVHINRPSSAMIFWNIVHINIKDFAFIIRLLKKKISKCNILISKINNILTVKNK
jgi:hypothetical protein